MIAMPNTATQTELKVADEVWIAAALLHRDHPEAPDFAVPASTFTSFNIASQTGPRNQVVIGCCSKPTQAAGASSANVIRIIRTARTQKSRPSLKIFRVATPVCSVG